MTGLGQKSNNTIAMQLRSAHVVAFIMRFQANHYTTELQYSSFRLFRSWLQFQYTRLSLSCPDEGSGVVEN